MSPTLDLVVLCAGRGERLRPLTDVCPKPLLPVVGTAMADRALAASEPLSPVRRLANAHHLPEQILAWAEARCLDHVQVEPELLDTGGALGRLEAEGEFCSGHVLVHNGDLVHDLDLRRAWKRHLESGADATLLVVDRPRINTVALRGESFAGVLGHPRGPVALPAECRARTFTGIAFYRRAALAGRPIGPWSVKELWHDLLEAGRVVRAWDAPEGSTWEDLGSARDFARVVREEIRRRGLARWIDPDACLAEDALVGEGCAVEFGALVGRRARIEDSVLLPGAEIPAGELVRGMLVNGGGHLPTGG
jgi:NDP-sugar pyrophosphorylase family protein